MSDLAETSTTYDNLLTALREGSFLGARLTLYRNGQVLARRDVIEKSLVSEVMALAATYPESDILIDAIERYQSVETMAFRQIFNNTNRGILGIRIIHEGQFQDVLASEMIATNSDFIDVVENFILEIGLKPREALEKLSFVSIHSRMFIFQPRDGALTKLYRGSLPQKRAPLTTSEIAEMASSLGAWFVQNMSPEGELPYKIYPSGNTRSLQQNNTIRQLMATVCIHRYAELVDNDELRDCARRNLAFNLKIFYRELNNYGVIAFNGSAKLGAAAMAALAIYEQEGRNGQHAHELAMLLQGIDCLWTEDGSFRTFHFPAGRNDNQNFYPGEALCLWARLLEDNLDPVLLERFFQSFRYYRQFHRKNLNPAFVPWHTMAYYTVWQLTHNAELAEFIFEMNDWLLDMQQIESAPCPDFVGRFYDPDRPEFGPPHASSTAVYIEGLIDAYRLAEIHDDVLRCQNYLRGLIRGMQNLYVLRITSPTSSIFSVSGAQLNGAIKTNPYDNTLRIDNMQHSIAALTKYLGFADKNWIPSGRR